jgi:NitT/TauT family transport system ATP-binding protein
LHDPVGRPAFTQKMESSGERCAIELRHVVKAFGDRPPVLGPLDLQVRRGECVVVLGPSGCGKTTLLRIIAGLTPASSGSVRVDPRQAFIFQEANLLPWATVAANIGLPLRLAGMPAAQRTPIVNRMAALVGLDHVVNDLPRQLSGGMQMRVSLARALATDPQILLMDEPFGALDTLTRNRLNEELLAMRRSAGWTTCFVTHSVTEAVFLADRIVILAANPGRIAASVTVDLPAPRSAATRLSPEFHARVAAVTRLLSS